MNMRTLEEVLVEQCAPTLARVKPASMFRYQPRDLKAEPMFADVEGALGGKKVALFGSYGWGDGQWMRDWVERCRNAGANLIGERLILNGTPDTDGEAQCFELGKQIAG
jgi:hypothetical protein